MSERPKRSNTNYSTSSSSVVPEKRRFTSLATEEIDLIKKRAKKSRSWTLSADTKALLVILSCNELEDRRRREKEKGRSRKEDAEPVPDVIAKRASVDPTSV